MASVISRQFTARIEGEFAVLLIGMRINKAWKVAVWWPLVIAMPRMVKALRTAGPVSGSLCSTPVRPGMIAQY